MSGHAEEALAGVPTSQCSLQCGSVNNKHLCEEIYIFGAASVLHWKLASPQHSHIGRCAPGVRTIWFGQFSVTKSALPNTTAPFTRGPKPAHKRLRSPVHPLSPPRPGEGRGGLLLRRVPVPRRAGRIAPGVLEP